MTEKELAELRITAYNADTGVDWRYLGNTFWIFKDEEDFIVIPGGVRLVRHIVAAQPRAIQRLLKERDGWKDRCFGEMKIQVRYRDSVDQWVRDYEKLQGELNLSQAAMARVKDALAEYPLMPADVCTGINEPADKVKWLIRRLRMLEE